MHRFLVPIFSALLGVSAAVAHDIENPFSILNPGNFQDVDVDDFDFPPKGWLALVVKDGHWELTPTTVNIDNQIVTSNEPKALALLHRRSLVSDREEASLVWAGDLDKDGKLDLILESSTDKNSTYCLYLSGAAGPRALVKKIGCQFYSG